MFLLLNGWNNAQKRWQVLLLDSVMRGSKQLCGWRTKFWSRGNHRNLRRKRVVCFLLWNRWTCCNKQLFSFSHIVTTSVTKIGGVSDDAQQKNHKAERENNTKNKQQQTKTGQGIGRDWQGKKGAPGNVVRNVRGNDDSSGVSVCSRRNPSWLLTSTPTKPWRNNPGLPSKIQAYLMCAHVSAARIQIAVMKSGWNLGSCPVWGCAEIRVYAMACWRRRRRRRRILSSLTLLTHSLSANVFRAGISPPTCWKFSSMLAFAIWLRAPFSR